MELLDDLEKFKNETFKMLDTAYTLKQIINTDSSNQQTDYKKTSTLSEGEQILLGEIKQKNDLITRLMNAINKKDKDIDYLQDHIDRYDKLVNNNDELVKQMSKDLEEKDDFIQKIMDDNRAIQDDNKMMLEKINELSTNKSHIVNSIKDKKEADEIMKEIKKRKDKIKAIKKKSKCTVKKKGN